MVVCFNTQPPEGDWGYSAGCFWRYNPYVSTHSRLKATGGSDGAIAVAVDVSTHSRLKATGTLRCHSISAISFQHTAA